MSKIKLTELSAHFPYKVKALFNATNEKGCHNKVIGTVGVIYDDCSITCYDTVNSSPEKYKLILYPQEVSNCESSSNDLLKRRVDIFGLIEKGLAVSVHDLPADPYKKVK